MAVVNIIRDRCKVDPIYQWDRNRILTICGVSLESIPEIHFANKTMKNAIVKQASMDDAGVITVQIPNGLLEVASPIDVYVCTYEGETFKALYKITVPVQARQKPDDYITEDEEEIYSYNALENLVVNALEQFDDAIEKAESYALNPPKISDDGYWMIWDVENNTYVKTSYRVGDVASEESLLMARAYSVNVPSDAAKYAKVKTIGGKTRKGTNLCKGVSSYNNTTVADGIVTQVNADTKTGSLSVKAVPYVNSSVESGSGTSGAVLGIVSVTFTKTNADKLRFGVNGSSTDTLVIMDISHLPAGTYTISANFTNLTQGSISWRDITINAGDTALPYEPYFEGLRSAPVSEVVSVGVNMFGGNVLANKLVDLASAVLNLEQKTVSFEPRNISEKILISSFKPNTQYTIILKGINSSVKYSNLYIMYTDETYEEILFDTENEVGTICKVSNASKSVDSIRGSWKAGTTTLYYDECGIFEGALSADNFKPYTEYTLLIPEAVQALDGYGEGIDASLYNYIDFEKKQYIKRVGKVDLNTMKWDYNSDNGLNFAYSSELTNLIKIDYKNPNMIAEKYTASAWGNNVVGNIMMNGTGVIRVYIEIANERPSGMLCYELSTPEIIDISDILPDGDIIVEGGGTLTYVNEYAYDVVNGFSYYNNTHKRVSATELIGDLRGTAERAVYDAEGNNIAASFQELRAKIDEILSRLN